MMAAVEEAEGKGSMGSREEVPEDTDTVVEEEEE
jgi:hypothetical protein